MESTLETVLILLAAGVLVVVLFQSLKLPAMLGYLLVGVAIGPNALGLLPDSPETRHLAEFGVVFLMFTLGLEFSLPKLTAMRRMVFGFGGAQVGLSVAAALALGAALGLNWVEAIALGGAFAMSSTAIVSKFFAERLEVQSLHGQLVIGALLFQDLAVVPFLILVPALASQSGGLAEALLYALAKAAVVLAVLLSVGQKLMRSWFHLVARQKSSELFVLNVLLITLGLAFLTEAAGLSLALGAFLAGMLISETEYRYHVEDDIKPFRDVLLGLFFVTIGMLLDLRVLLDSFGWVAAILLGLVLGKALLTALVARAFGYDLGTAWRAGLALGHAGEFSFVLLSQAGALGLMTADTSQPLLAAVVLSMAVAPFLLQYSDATIRLLFRGEWTHRAMDLHQIAVRGFGVENHILICGYGRSGQGLARFLERESVPYLALDLDPDRVRSAQAGGENVVYGDALRREVLVAAGLSRARAVVVTFAETAAAMRILEHVQAVHPQTPVVVRTVDDSDLPRLMRAGAAEVVPELLEGSLMLASHALMLAGVPLRRVMARIREMREERYQLFRGFYLGASDEAGEVASLPRLQTVLLGEGAAGVGKTLGEAGLTDLGVEVMAVRRRNIRGLDPGAETRLQAGDVLVLRGTPEALASAEIRLMQG